MQNADLIHVHGRKKIGPRMLVHFYAVSYCLPHNQCPASSHIVVQLIFPLKYNSAQFLFFADWRHDLWTKRFVRDHLRYVDEIQCAAARVVRNYYGAIVVPRTDSEFLFMCFNWSMGIVGLISSFTLMFVCY